MGGRAPRGKRRTLDYVIVLVITPVLVGLWCWRISARKRFVATIKRMAETGLSAIGGQSVERWLDVLNQGTAYTLVAIDAVVVTYQGRELFFVDGTIGYLGGGKYGGYTVEKLCFLVAVGESAVTLLSEQEQVFARIAGSSELAAFGIRRYSGLVAMLMAERRRGMLR